MSVDQEIPEFGTSNYDLYINDVDHLKLSMLISKYIDCLSIEQCPYTCNMVLRTVAFVAQKHFAEEEMVMRNYNYGHYLAHKESHTWLLAHINGLVETLDHARSIEEIDAPSVIQFLIKWFSDHSFHEDCILHDYLTIVRSPH